MFFENEGIEIRPDSSAYDNVRLSIYLMIAEYPKIAEDYVRYMMKYVREADRKPVVREDK